MRIEPPPRVENSAKKYMLVRPKKYHYFQLYPEVVMSDTLNNQK